MESERGGYKSDAVGDRPSGQSLGTALDKKPVNLQAVFVGECSERIDYLGSLHDLYDITTRLEMSSRVGGGRRGEKAQRRAAWAGTPRAHSVALVRRLTAAVV